MEKTLKGTSLKVRFLQILAVSIFLCLLLITLVIRFSWTVAQHSRVETSLTATLQDIINRIDSEYNALLQISQNMIATGLIGEKYDDYLSAEEQYDRFDDYRAFANSLNIAAFGAENVLLTVYFTPNVAEPGAAKVIYSNFTVSGKFDPESLPVLLTTNEIIFHPIHHTYNSVLNKDVVSIMRSTVFSDGREAEIYLEANSDVISYLHSRAELEKTEYVFLKLDPEDRVIYSNSEAFPVGTAISIDEKGMVEQNHYIGVAEKSGYGFNNILLIPVDEYSYQTNQWIFGVSAAVLISFCLLAVVTLSQIWLINRPLKALEKEMAGLGDGNFSVSEYHFNLKEFDRLFEVFNRMKQQIRSLMDKNRKQEKEKARLELEKLEYQINPHFLMNALNTVHWMAIADNAPDIDSYVNRLGYILSYSLGKVDYQTTLRTELHSLEKYLELQQTTYDFEYELDVEEGDYLDRECARFILQPVAENAVCHNMDEFGHLWVCVWQEERRICITITDDGKGFVMTAEGSDEEEESRNKGIGLRYVRVTLEAVYGELAEMKIDSKPGEGTAVWITLPNGDGYVSRTDN